MTPRSLEEATSPRPKWNCQTRLAITRAASGFSGLRQPARQPEPATGRLGPSASVARRLLRRQDGRQPRLGGGALLVRVAALEHVGDRRLRPFLIPDVRVRQLLVSGFDGGEPFFQRSKRCRHFRRRDLASLGRQLRRELP